MDPVTPSPPVSSSSRLVQRLHELRGAAPALLGAGGATTFEDLVGGALAAAGALCRGAPSLAGARVVLLTPAAADAAGDPGLFRVWLTSFLGVVLAGGVAVPLSPAYPPAELGWFAADARASVVVLLGEENAARGAAMAEGRRLVTAGDLARATPVGPRETLADDQVALILYTSGTTGKPKGALITHANVAHQAALLREAWGLGGDDVLLHALPLHHLHGLGISLLSVLLAGGAVRAMPRFEPRAVWGAFARGDSTVWMAVPTMYQKLFEAFDAADAATRASWAAGATRLRLATSGSAALPTTLAERWRELTGAIPLERFGMTEIGVGMSNPLDRAARRAGTVGPPLPTVESRIVGDDGADGDGPGELWIRGPSVFAGYFGRDEASRDAFTTEGWFRTGDVAQRSPDGYVRLLGRTSVDILKSGGYKLSALEIEEALRENPAVAEVAVVGLYDVTWGERVVAAIVPVPGRADACATEAIRGWARDRLVAYKIPREVVVVDSLPRNALGKVMKPELVKLLASR